MSLDEARFQVAQADRYRGTASELPSILQALQGLIQAVEVLESRLDEICDRHHLGGW